jgi:threonine synthase
MPYIESPNIADFLNDDQTLERLVHVETLIPTATAAIESARNRTWNATSTIVVALAGAASKTLKTVRSAVRIVTIRRRGAVSPAKRRALGAF